MSDFEGSQAPNDNPALSKSVVTWGIAAAALSFVALTWNTSPMVMHASLAQKALAFCLCAPMGLVGALLGDGFRKFARPDVMFTSGIGSLVWQKIFWRIGPQTIGCAVGVFTGIALVLGK